MSVQIREIRPEDEDALTALWQRVFEDPEDFVRGFLRLLPALGTGAAAVEDGRVLGAAYILTELWLEEPGRSRRCAYLYAVAVDERARGRGLGRTVSQAAAALGRARGAQILCTLPAGESLYGWYEQILQLRCGLWRRRLTVSAGPGPEPELLTAEAYGRRRETLLAGRPHLRLSEAALRLEELNCRLFGGGLYALDGGIAAAYLREGTGVIREALGLRPEQAASLGAALGVERMELFLPAPEGEPYLAFSPAELPPDTVWNLAFD